MGPRIILDKRAVRRQQSAQRRHKDYSLVTPTAITPDARPLLRLETAMVRIITHRQSAGHGTGVSPHAATGTEVTDSKEKNDNPPAIHRAWYSAIGRGTRGTRTTNITGSVQPGLTDKARGHLTCYPSNFNVMA